MHIRRSSTTVRLAIHTKIPKKNKYVHKTKCRAADKINVDRISYPGCVQIV